MMHMPVLMALHDEKGHVAPHFDNVDQKNTVMPLMKTLASCDTDTGTSGIT